MEEVTNFAHCTNCGKPLTHSQMQHHARFCCGDCGAIYRLTRYGERKVRYGGRSTGTIGAASELIVSVNLLDRNFSVFRSLSPNAPCDLVVIVNNKCYRVEVRGAIVNKSGKLSYPHSKKDIGRSDILALCLPDGSIEYRPSIADITEWK